MREEMAGSNPNHQITSPELKLTPKSRFKLLYLTLGSSLAFFVFVFLIIFAGVAVAIIAQFLTVLKAFFHRRRRHETQIPLFSNAMAGGEPVVCVVCFEELGALASRRRLRRCRHEFHAKCIDRWLVNSLACPMCRLPVVFNVTNGVISC